MMQNSIPKPAEQEGIIGFDNIHKPSSETCWSQAEQRGLLTS